MGILITYSSHLEVLKTSMEQDQRVYERTTTPTTHTGHRHREEAQSAPETESELI